LFIAVFRDIDMTEVSEACDEVPHKLWVDRYAPRTYTDLLSEEVAAILFFTGFQS